MSKKTNTKGYEVCMKKARVYFLPVMILICIGMVLFVYVYNKQNDEDKRIRITIAVVQDDQVQDFNSNYYTTWLEEQTGYDITFKYIPTNYDKEYMSALLSAQQGSVDAVFFSRSNKILSLEELEEYSSKGYLEDLTAYTQQENNLHKALREYQDIQLKEKITSKDGGIYYFPQLNTAKKECNFQVLWINVEWLKNLEMEIPKTTQDLRKVLLAFKENDPNGNGLTDEIPLLGCEETSDLCSYYYILNSFVYIDPRYMEQNSGDKDTICFAGETKELEKGFRYLQQLYSDGLLGTQIFTFSKKQLQEAVNSPGDIVGAFTSQSIADVVYANSPEVIARYIQVSPLLGEGGERNAVNIEPEPEIGSIIPSNSAHKEETYKLMDLMLSKEASLIAEYGQEGVDWDYSDNSNLSVYGTKAKIKTVHYLSDKLQNQNYNGAGPHIVEGQYLDGVTWNGNSSDVEYIDVRAVLSYAPYYRDISEWKDGWKSYKGTISDVVKGATK